MRDLTVSEESCQHREGLICERLIDERLLPLKRFNGTARWKVVRVVENRCDNLREQFRNGGKPARRFAIAVILRLSEHKLPAVRGIAEVQPIDALFEERRLRNVEPRGTRVHASNNDVRFTLSFRGHILG
jgi:hypothetical protein